MTNYWRSFGLLIFVSACFDYWIATLLASRDEEVWFLFSLLLLAPIFFSLKSGVVRLVVWYFFQRCQQRSQMLDYLRKHDFPKPDEFETANLNGPEDYLERLSQDESVSASKKQEIDRTIGVVQGLNQTQRTITKLIWSLDFHHALKRYANVS